MTFSQLPNARMLRTFLRLKNFLACIGLALLCGALVALIDVAGRQRSTLPRDRGGLSEVSGSSAGAVIRPGARHPAGADGSSASEVTRNAQASVSEDKSPVAEDVVLPFMPASPVKLLNLTDGIFDNTRQYQLYPFMIRANRVYDDPVVCLSTQVSFDRLGDLDELSRAWTGPISAVVYVPGMEFGLTRQAVEFLRSCRPDLRDRVSFHYVTDGQHPPSDPFFDGNAKLEDVKFSCEDLTGTLRALQDLRSESFMEWRTVLAYPQNVLRNAARSTCPGEFTYTPDADMIPSGNMYEQLRTFLKEEPPCAKCAYVVPVYEIHSFAKELPQTKKDLLSLIHRGRARVFHTAITKKNSASSDLKKWQKLPPVVHGKIVGAYEIDSYQIGYEPVYIARADVPKFDERFVGYGSTRYTQAFEMYLAGYHFVVLDNVFLSHRGFQSIKNRPEWRAKQQMENNKKMEAYAKEVLARYGGKDDKYFLKFAQSIKNVKVAFKKS